MAHDPEMNPPTGGFLDSGFPKRFVRFVSFPTSRTSKKRGRGKGTELKSGLLEVLPQILSDLAKSPAFPKRFLRFCEPKSSKVAKQPRCKNACSRKEAASGV